MAVILQMTYSKKLGLPNYSSHQCSVSLQAEIADLNQIGSESSRLYALMQTAVDREMQEVGFLPDATTYGMKSFSASRKVPEAEETGRYRNSKDAWNCSDKQRQLIEKIVCENVLDKRDVEELSLEMFGAGVKQLNRLQASGLIDELFERHGRQRRQGGSGDGGANGRQGRYQRETRGASR